MVCAHHDASEAIAKSQYVNEEIFQVVACLSGEQLAKCHKAAVSTDAIKHPSSNKPRVDKCSAGC